MSNGTAVQAANPFGSGKLASAQASAVADAAAAREVAEIQGAMMIARKFPRDQKAAMDRILQACTRKSLAEEATFQYARGGTDIAAPSIRLAEAIAQNWGNLECGVKEMSRVGEYSEVMAYAVDLETGFRDSKVFQVRHWRDTKSGGYKITEERDIYELIANMAARRKRACILTVIPGDVVDAAMDQIEVTMKADIEITEETVNGVLESMAKFGVTKEMIEKRIQRRLDATTLSPALYLNLKRIYQSMKDGMSGPDEWFDTSVGAESAGEDVTTTAGRASAAARKAREEAERKAKEDAEKKPKTEAKAPADAKKADKKAAPKEDAGASGAAQASAGSAPVTAQDVGGGALGSEEVKQQIMADMEKADSTDKLAELADSAQLYKWSDADRQEITAKYLARLEKLEA